MFVPKVHGNAHWEQMRVGGDHLTGWCSAVIQAIAMHENRLPVSKSQLVSQPAGTGSQQSGPVSYGPAIVCPQLRGRVPEGTGTLTCLAANGH